jgi:hypothetical protein
MLIRTRAQNRIKDTPTNSQHTQPRHARLAADRSKTPSWLPSGDEILGGGHFMRLAHALLCHPPFSRMSKQARCNFTCKGEQQ